MNDVADFGGPGGRVDACKGICWGDVSDAADGKDGYAYILRKDGPSTGTRNVLPIPVDR